VRKLSENMTLALVFDAETPFSTIRSQAGKLVKNLFESSYDEMGQAPSPVNSRLIPNPNYDLPDKGDYQDIPPISELLGEVPPPIPPRPALNINLPWDQPSPTASAAPTDVAETVIGVYSAKPQAQTSSDPDKLVSNESSPPMRRGAPKRPMPAMDETFAGQALAPDKPGAMLRIGVPDELQVTRKQEHFDPESVIETRGQAVAESITDVAHRILLESPSLSQVNLTYACLLIPRFDHHHLVGDAAARLNEWVPQLCVAFGWRLEYISVRPDYLQWITRVPLNTAAGYVINTIRKHTSERYFAEFPRFKADNPSGEFWARGFIVQGGSQPHPQKLIRDFIKQTRMRQGLR